MREQQNGDSGSRSAEPSKPAHSLGRGQFPEVSSASLTERVLASLPSGVLLVDGDMQVMWFNRALEDLLGEASTGLVGRNLADLEPHGSEALTTMVRTLLDESTHPVFEPQQVVLDLGGPRQRELPVSISGSLVPGTEGEEPMVVLNIVEDTAQIQEVERLSYLANHDDLTGLVNRRGFREHMERHMELCRDEGPTGGLIFVDLDDFKKVNDTLGHQAGDDMLVLASQLLRASVRASDVVARIGGDEFAILLPDADRKLLERVARRIVGASKNPETEQLSLSVGAATFEAAFDAGEEVTALADLAMYNSKRDHMSSYTILPETADSEDRELEKRRGEIIDAFEACDFAILFQPILDVNTNQVAGCEALLRMFYNDTIISPDEFLPIAEGAGLMPEIDAWVARNVISWIPRFLERCPGATVAINLSGHSIGHPEVERAIAQALEEYEVPSGKLVLEVTETAPIRDLKRANSFLGRLIALGCQVAIDDYGAGHATYTYLKNLDHHYIKIAGDFVQDAPYTRGDRTVLRQTVEMAQALHRKTVAEKASTQDHLEVVREERVDFAQGNAVGKPVPLDEFFELYGSSSEGEGDPLNG